MKRAGGALGLLIAVLPLSACDAGTNPPAATAKVLASFEKPGLRFTASACDRSARTEGAATKSGWEGVKSANWRGDGILEVKAALVENCGVRFTDAGFVLAGNALTLAYAAGVSGDAVARCNCLFGLRYEISSIPRGDYAIQFRGSGMEPD